MFSYNCSRHGSHSYSSRSGSGSGSTFGCSSSISSDDLSAQSVAAVSQVVIYRLPGGKLLFLQSIIKGKGAVDVAADIGSPNRAATQKPVKQEEALALLNGKSKEGSVGSDIQRRRKSEREKRRQPMWPHRWVKAEKSVCKFRQNDVL